VALFRQVRDRPSLDVKPLLQVAVQLWPITVTLGQLKKPLVTCNVG